MKLGERLEIAIANASARGFRINLGRPIKEYANYDYAAHRRPPRPRVVGTDEQGKPVRIPGTETALGRQTRTPGRGGWTHEQLAFAASGMHELHFAALLWCLDRDEPSRVTLKAQLLMEAVRIKERRKWPPKIRRADCKQCGHARSERKYLQDLCTLALLEGAEPRAFSSEAARADWFGISERHWRRAKIGDGYAEISQQLVRWYASGYRYLLDRLRSAAQGAERTPATT